MNFGKLFDLGEKLGEMIFDDFGTGVDVESVCEKFGQYSSIHGVDEQHVDLFYQLWKQQDETLNMSMLTYGEWIMNNDYEKGRE